MESDKKDVRVIQSVQRAIDIINCFDESHTTYTLMDVSRIVGLNKSTAYGILSTLCANKYLHKNSKNEYMLGSELLEKTRYSMPTGRTLLMNVTLPYLTDLCQKYPVTANLYIMEEEQPVIVHQVFPASGIYYVFANIYHPLHCTATGKLALLYMREERRNEYLDRTGMKPMTEFSIRKKGELLAVLEEIRENGYACEDQELGEDVYALSVPIVSKNNNLFGAFSLTSGVTYMTKHKDELVAAMQSAAESISRELFASDRATFTNG